MSIRLTRLAEEIDLENPKEVSFSLIIDNKGKEIRVPITSEGAQILIENIYVEREESPSLEEDPNDDKLREFTEEPLEEFAEEFGGEFDDNLEEEEDRINSPVLQPDWEEDFSSEDLDIYSEEDIPTL